MTQTRSGACEDSSGGSIARELFGKDRAKRKDELLDGEPRRRSIFLIKGKAKKAKSMSCVDRIAEAHDVPSG